MPSRPTFAARFAPLLAAVGIASAVWAPAALASAPPIRISDTSQVPRCVTPQRLMAFLRARNPNLDARFKDIAEHYRRHGETHRVRWDYAFFQMAIETNFLTFRAPSGRRGDVSPSQNNFAGIGTTGGGVPGDRYPDVSTGVLAQVQHLVVYSGERIDSPVAPRTRLKQDDILNLSQPIVRRRPVTFQDLSGRWAVDRAYGRSIQWVADQFAKAHCQSGDQIAEPTPAGDTKVAAASMVTALRPPEPTLVWRATPRSGPIGAGEAAAKRGRQPMRLGGLSSGTEAAPASPEKPVAAVAHAPAIALLPTPSRCRVLTASYGGTRTVLVEALDQGERQLTALTVQAGFEASMADSYIRGRTSGGKVIETFDAVDAAIARAHELCGIPRAPSGRG